jgi:hypothetical protein
MRAPVRHRGAGDAALMSVGCCMRSPPSHTSLPHLLRFAPSPAPAPQRVNGRVAMLGFVGIMLAEHGSKTPALEQFGDDFLGVALLSLAITLGSIFPKFASGSSLKVRGMCGSFS